MTFTEYVQNECGVWTDINTLLENLLKDQILELIEEYKSLNNGEINLSAEEIKAFDNIIDKGYI